jgi:hypothetical protein
MRDLIGAPIFLRLGARMRGPAKVPVGVLRRVILSNITCQSAAAPLICSILAGIPDHPIEDIKISDIVIFHQGGGSKDDAMRQLAEKETDYPEPSMFGTTPAQGFFIRHVRGLEMFGVKIEHANEDARPAFVLHNVLGADFERVKVPSVAGAPTFVLNDVRDFGVFRSRPVPDTELPTAAKKEI